MATLLHESQIAWARPRVETFPTGEARALEIELRKRIEGEVRFDTGSRALYATDGSNYRQVPIGVVVPKTIEDVVVTVEQCRRSGALYWREAAEPAWPVSAAMSRWCLISQNT